MKLEHKGFIQVLNDRGYTVVEIDEELFVSTEFNRAHVPMRHHFLSGKEITSIANNYVNLPIGSTVNSSAETISQLIDNLPVIRREFHCDYKEKVYLPNKR